MIRYRKLLVLALCALFVAPAFGQQPVVISGTVTDATGAVLPGTTIEAMRGNRSVAVVTAGSDGRYRLELPAGDYRLQAQLDGFSTSTASVMAGPGATRDFQLGLAPVNDTVVVTASRTSKGRAAVTDVLTVFTTEDIQALGSHSVGDLLGQIPGLNVESTGREGSGASLLSRGGESDYNQVLIDGVQVNTSGGAFDFSRVSTNEIERVEVVRGAQSALYGSDAIGSVVQIFTKRGSATGAPQVYGSVEGGTYNTVRSDLRVLGGAQDRVDYQLGAAYRGTDGAFEDQLTERDRFDQISYDGNIGAIIGDQIRVSAGGRYSRARGQSVGQIGFTPAGDTGSSYNTEDYSYHLRVDQTPRSWFNHSAGTTYFRNDRVTTDAIGDAFGSVYAVLEGTPGAIFPDSPRLVRLLDETAFDSLVADPSGLGTGEFLATTPFGVFDFPFDFRSEFRRYTFEYQANATWMDGQVLSAGYEYDRAEDRVLETDESSAGFRIEDHAFFAQQQFTFLNQWFATVGVRVDDNSRFGTEASPKLSVGGYPIAIGDGTVSSVKVFANIGKGIKNPTFGELFGSDFSDGNPDLKPERATTIDVGTEVTFDAQRWLGRVTYFDNDYEDQVAFLYSAGFYFDGIPDFLNIARSQARGVELEGGLQRPIGGVTAMASYAFVDTEVVATVSASEQFQPGQALLRRPTHSGNIRVSYTRGPASVNLNVRMTGQRHDASFIGLARVPDGLPVDITVNPGYTLVGLSGQYRVHDDLTLFLRAENLTDAEYESALGYPGMPRAFVIGGRFNIGLGQ